MGLEITIQYSSKILQTRNVKLKVYDILGNEAAYLVNEAKAPGNSAATFDASSFASGIYFYRLHAGEYLSIKKMILLK